MKRYFFLIFLGLTIHIQSQAQKADFQERTYLGFKAGYNYGTASFGHALQRINIVEGYKPGIHFGLIGINYMEKNIGLQVELNYTQKGWTQLFDPGTPKFTTDLDYIEMPMYMNVYIGEKKLRMFFNLGIYAEYLIRAKASALPADTQGYDFYPYDSSRDRKFGYGMIAGGGFYRDFGFGTLMIQGAFSYGISNVLDPITEDSGIPDLSNLLTSSFSVGYMIKLGK